MDTNKKINLIEWKHSQTITTQPKLTAWQYFQTFCVDAKTAEWMKDQDNEVIIQTHFFWGWEKGVVGATEDFSSTLQFLSQNYNKSPILQSILTAFVRGFGDGSKFLDLLENRTS